MASWDINNSWNLMYIEIIFLSNEKSIFVGHRHTSTSDIFFLIKSQKRGNQQLKNQCVLDSYFLYQFKKDLSCIDSKQAGSG